MVNTYVAGSIRFFLAFQLQIIQVVMVKKMIGLLLLFHLYDEMNPYRHKKTVEVDNYLGELT